MRLRVSGGTAEFEIMPCRAMKFLDNRVTRFRLRLFKIKEFIMTEPRVWSYRIQSYDVRGTRFGVVWSSVMGF